MEVQAFLAIAAIAIPDKEVALGHFPSGIINSGGILIEMGGRLTSCTHARTRKLHPFCRASEANACTPDYNHSRLVSFFSPRPLPPPREKTPLVETRAHGMFIWTRIPHGTVSLDKQRTCPPVRIEAKPVLLPQEIVERKPPRKLLVLRGRVEDLVGDALGGCSRHRRGGCTVVGSRDY